MKLNEKVDEHLNEILDMKMENVSENHIKNRTILIFTTRQLCYSSAVFFAARLSDAFEELGYAVEMCELDSLTNTNRGDEQVLSQQSEQKLESYLDRSFYAVFDFNSRLPRMIMDDGSYYLDHIDAPFYDYILDHPLYHHRSLSCQLKNFNVIMVDQKHCEYVKKYYPHIKQVIWQTLGASEAVHKSDQDQKQCELLFMGTYRDPKEYWNLILQSSYKQIMLDMTELMLADTCVTIGDALSAVLLDNEIEVNPQQFSELMNQVYPVELYVRNYHRKCTIDALYQAHIPMTFVGEWWNQYIPEHSIEKPGSDHVRYENGVTFAQSFERIAKSAVLLDSSPFFQFGIHDRVFAGMANRSVVLTDRNPCKQELFCSGNSIKQQAGMTYTLSDQSDLVYKAEELLINHELRTEIVDNAYQIYKKGYDWTHVASHILKSIITDSKI